MQAVAGEPRLSPRPVVSRRYRGLERRRPEDVFETHYRMNTEKDVLSLASQAGLKVDRFSQISSVATTAIFGPLAIPELFGIRTILESPEIGRAHV